MAYRGHEPINLTTFKGLWDQGSEEEVPPDHFTNCNNIRFVGNREFASRYGVGIHQDVGAPLKNIARMYNYVTNELSTLIVLCYDKDSGFGQIFHVIDASTVYGPLLTIAGMEDFAFVSYGGRAYISPFNSVGPPNNLQQRGLGGEFLYVYMGDGTPARKAAGQGPPLTPPVTVANGASGYTDAGVHLFGVVFETNSGYLSPPGAFREFTTSSTSSVSFTSIPVSPDPAVVKRHIVATRRITDFNGNMTGYSYYFIPLAEINNNVATTLSNISFYDADLLADASYLLDSFSEIPAGAVLGLYHNRLCIASTEKEESIIYVSASGEPEAIDQVDGLLVMPPDGNPITQVQELRDVLYGFKKNRTSAWVDNDDIPASWPLSIVDQALGCPIHGVAAVADAGYGSVDYLIVSTFRGVTLFNGKYIQPELSWKISNRWLQIDRNDFYKIQSVQDPIQQIIYICLPDGTVLVGNYSNGLDPMEIRWTPWTFDMQVNTIALVNTDELVFGADYQLVG